MNIDELERRTREQIRDLQDEYRQRLAPLHKILTDIEMTRPPKPLILSKEEASGFFGASVMSSPAVKEAKKQMNKFYRELVDNLEVKAQ